MSQAHVAFDPNDTDFQQNPYPTWDALREEGLVRHPAGFWIAARHDHVNAILGDRRFGRDWPTSLATLHGDDWAKEPIWRYSADTMLFLNPPEHTRLRKLFTRAFSARRVYAAEGFMRAEADRLLEAAGDTFDFVRDFALPFPVRVACELAGIPALDAMRVGELVADLLLHFEVRPLTRAELDRCNNALAELEAMFTAQLTSRRAAPGEDLLSELAAECTDARQTQLVAWNLIHVFAAAFETTAGVMANSLYLSLRQPGLWQQIVEHGVDGPLIEELLRIDISTQIGGRNALEDVEFAGRFIGKGEPVFLALGAACRDPAVYPEPERIDPARDAPRTAAFGGGIHMCLGALLARTEVRHCYEALAARYPGLSVAPGFTPAYRPTSTLRLLTSLPLSG